MCRGLSIEAMFSIEELHLHFILSAGACTDTRQLKAGGIFFALKGPNFNANSFADRALEGGCAFVVVDDPATVKDERYLLVPDVLGALKHLGRYHRRQFNIPVIGITGSNGKTTTKELMHAVLNADRPTLATVGNLNNHIGVPLTLLGLTAEHRIAIIEMGANHVGDVAELVAIAEPTHGIITNIGKAHLEGFGGYAGVIKAKTEMYDFIRTSKGVLFVNADDPLLMEKSTGIERRLYGSTENCDTRGGIDDVDDAFLRMHFSDREHQGRFHVETRLIGAYNAANVLCAACVGQQFDVPDQTIADAIGDYAPTNNRSQFIDTGRNQVVMDAYNANPSSVRAALENFAAMKSERGKLVLLGDMLELGSESASEHEAIAELLRAMRLDAWLIGPEFLKAAGGGSFQRFAAASEALAHAQSIAINGKLILVKGSRGIKLETLLPVL